MLSICETTYQINRSAMLLVFQAMHCLCGQWFYLSDWILMLFSFTFFFHNFVIVACFQFSRARSVLFQIFPSKSIFDVFRARRVRTDNAKRISNYLASNGLLVGEFDIGHTDWIPPRKKYLFSVIGLLFCS